MGGRSLAITSVHGRPAIGVRVMTKADNRNSERLCLGLVDPCAHVSVIPMDLLGAETVIKWIPHSGEHSTVMTLGGAVPIHPGVAWLSFFDDRREWHAPPGRGVRIDLVPPLSEWPAPLGANYRGQSLPRHAIIGANALEWAGGRLCLRYEPGGGPFRGGLRCGRLKFGRGRVRRGADFWLSRLLQQHSFAPSEE